MDTLHVLSAQRTWAHAQTDLDTYLTRVLAAGLLAPQQGVSTDAFALITDEQAREIGVLYGKVVGLWSLYCELRELVVGSPGFSH